MKVIKALLLDKYKNEDRYSLIENFIYKDETGGVGGKMGLIHNPVYCITLYCELEDGEIEDMQYPLEDILDEYYVNCTEVYDVKEIGGKCIFVFEVEGEDLFNLKKLFDLVGKRIFNYEVDDSIELRIESGEG